MTFFYDQQARYAMLIFVFINAIFLFVVPLLPFIDLPNHLAEATIYKYWSDADNVLAKYYKPAAWYSPNTFHTLFCSLFPSVEFGNKVFYIFYIALLQGSLYLIIRHINGNAWYGLLGLLFIYNYNVTFGFSGYAISIPTTLLLFYFTLLDIRYDKLALKIFISLLLVLLFLMHAQAALFGLLLYGCMILYHYRKSFKKIFIHGVLTSIPLLLIIFSWWFSREEVAKEESTLHYLFRYYRFDYLQDFIIRFRIIVFDNFQLREGMPGLILATLIFSCVILPLIFFRPWRTKEMGPVISSETIYPLIFFLTAFACYLFLPDKLPGQSPLFQRFCTLVIFAFIILASVWMNRVTTPALKYFSLFAVICSTALWFEYIYTFNRQNKNFTAGFFKDVNNESTLAGLIYENQYRGRKVYIHFPNYYLVWTKGIAASKIIDYRFGVVRRTAHQSEIPIYNELIGEGYQPTPEYAHLDYLLVRGKAPVSSDVNLHNTTLVRESGEWKLYKHTY
jgi:hypothetical protein